jgi:hypothetical protein
MNATNSSGVQKREEITWSVNSSVFMDDDFLSPKVGICSQFYK